MRKKIPTAIALLCIIVYVTAVLFAAYRVYNSVRRQTHLAGQELDGLREFIFQSGPEFLDRDNREKILKRMAESKTLEGIIITGSFGSGLTFEREKGKVITGEGGRYSFKNGFGLISLPARQVAVRNFRNVNIYSQNNIIDYPYFITVLKQTLMAVLAALTLSFIAFLLEAVSGKRPETAEEAGESAARAAPSGGVEEPSGSSFDDSAFTDEYGPSFFEEPDKGEAPGGDPEDFDFGDFGDFDDTGNGGDFGLEEGTEAEEDPLPDDFLDEIELELPEDKEGKAKTAGPEGLYSPRGNIGWEEYTKDRLASEIHRCAASEQDLTVLLAEWDEKVDCTEELFNSFAAEAVKFFNLKDLTFVKGKKGLSVIIPGADLKQGIRKAEEFHSRIIKALGDTSGVREGLRVGISSRSGRLIDAERLLFEAANALAKTSPPSPIVAFKSDPEKYRDFIRRENQ